MSKLEKQVYKLEDGAIVTYVPHFLSQKQATTLFNELKLKKNIPWTHGIYKIFGKSVKTPRLLYAMRDKDVDITGSYKVTDSMEWLPEIETIKKKVEKVTGKKISYAQLNYYRDGDDHIGYHCDSEVQDGDIIASLSLGAARKFVLRHKDYQTRKDIEKKTFTLENGSLLIMNDNAAKHKYKHTLPKMKDVGPRINVTFRPR